MSNEYEIMAVAVARWVRMKV